MKYCPGIDGLRAIAVLAVLAFHVGAPLSGGFVGVDVFLVISGYLITGQLMSALRREELSLSAFYARRAKRLLPVLALVFLVVLGLGALMMTPSQLLATAKSALWSGALAGNVYFATHLGYFDAAAERTPLLHVWSLSLEEQFYLVYPLLLSLCVKLFGRRGLKLLLLGTAVPSLLLCFVLTQSHSNFAYFLLPTRGWQFACGAALHLLPVPVRASGGLVAGGLLGVGASFFIIQGLGYPGFAALLPTLASAAVVWGSSGEKDEPSWARSWLEHPLLVGLGRASYSIYLWHWPLIAFYRIYFNVEELGVIGSSTLACLSLALGVVSARLVEEPLRRRTLSTPAVFRAALIGMGSVASFGIAVVMSRGWEQRLDAPLRALVDTKSVWSWECVEQRQLIPGLEEKFCIVGAPWEQAKHRGIVWGDSHSQHWAPLLDPLAQEQNISLIIAPLRCPIYLSEQRVRSHYPKYPNLTSMCTQRNQATAKWLRSSTEVEAVILAAAWSGHVRMLYTPEFPKNRFRRPGELGDASAGAPLSESALGSAIKDLGGARRVLILGDVPRPNRNLTHCLLAERSGLLRRPCTSSERTLRKSRILAWHGESNQALLNVAKADPNVRVLLPHEGLCGEEECISELEGSPLYADGNHLRRNLPLSVRRQLAALVGLDEALRQLYPEEATH